MWGSLVPLQKGRNLVEQEILAAAATNMHTEWTGRRVAISHYGSFFKKYLKPQLDIRDGAPM
jgi:hypothetical protein